MEELSEPARLALESLVGGGALADADIFDSPKSEQNNCALIACIVLLCSRCLPTQHSHATYPDT